MPAIEEIISAPDITKAFGAFMFRPYHPVGLLRELGMEGRKRGGN